MFRFPWGDMHSLNLGWFLQKFNELREDWATAEAGIDGALDAEIQRAEDALSDVFAARDAAAASATAAAGSATAAGTSATAAQNSATAAGNSATLANNKATAAGLSEAAAAQSATQAGNSATAAAGSATTASAAATNAAGSAADAAASAASIEGDVDAAAASATAAANSATAAAGSAAAAEQSAESVEASAEQIQINANNIDSLKTENNLNGIGEKVTAFGLTAAEIARLAALGLNVGLVGNRLTIQGQTTAAVSVGLSGGQNIPIIAKTTCFNIRKTSGSLPSYLNMQTGYFKSDATPVQVGYPLIPINRFSTIYYPEEAAFYRHYIRVPGNEQINIELELTALSKNIPLNNIAPVISDMYADDALTINDFRICDNTLYKITTPVALFANLIEGTNCVKTTVCAEIKTLL